MLKIIWKKYISWSEEKKDFTLPIFSENTLEIAKSEETDSENFQPHHHPTPPAEAPESYKEGI